MTRFPVDAPIARVKRALEALGFQLVREGNHIAMARQNHRRNTHQSNHTEPSAAEIVDSEDGTDSDRNIAGGLPPSLRPSLIQFGPGKGIWVCTVSKRDKCARTPVFPTGGVLNGQKLSEHQTNHAKDPDRMRTGG
jgi:hypothetical protein